MLDLFKFKAYLYLDEIIIIRKLHSFKELVFKTLELRNLVFKATLVLKKNFNFKGLSFKNNTARLHEHK